MVKIDLKCQFDLCPDVYLSIFIYFVTLITEYHAKGCMGENKSKKFKVRIKRMTWL